MREALAVLVAAALCASVARAQWAVSDGQQLADAATAWGLQNSDATFALPAASILSLRNATFRLANNAQAVGRRAYANGTFTIQGRAGSVIDTGMRAGMVPTLFSKARLRIEEVRGASGNKVRRPRRHLEPFRSLPSSSLHHGRTPTRRPRW